MLNEIKMVCINAFNDHINNYSLLLNFLLANKKY